MELETVYYRMVWSLPQKGTVWKFWVGFGSAGKEGYPFIVIWSVVRKQERMDRIPRIHPEEHLRYRPGYIAWYRPAGVC